MKFIHLYSLFFTLLLIYYINFIVINLFYLLIIINILYAKNEFYLNLLNIGKLLNYYLSYKYLNIKKLDCILNLYYYLYNIYFILILSYIFICAIILLFIFKYNNLFECHIFLYYRCNYCSFSSKDIIEILIFCIVFIFILYVLQVEV